MVFVGGVLIYFSLLMMLFTNALSIADIPSGLNTDSKSHAMCGSLMYHEVDTCEQRCRMRAMYP